MLHVQHVAGAEPVYLVGVPTFTYKVSAAPAAFIFFLRCSFVSASAISCRMVSSSLESTLEATESALALDAALDAALDTALVANFPASRAPADHLRESPADWAGDVAGGAANGAGLKQTIDTKY
jgi:hypothetical protein